MKNTRKRKIYFADLETTSYETNYYNTFQDVKINVGYIQGNDETNVGLYFLSFKEMIHWIWEKSESCYIYFHNLSFDGIFLIKWLVNNGYRLVNDDVKKKNRDFSCFRQLNKMYGLDLCVKGKKKNLIYISFRCSLLILSSSIKDLGKSIGKNKYEGIDEKELDKFYCVEPKDDVNKYDKKYLEYLKQDVEIAKESINIFEKEINWYLNKHKIDLKWYSKLTIGGIAYSLQQKYLIDFPHVKKGLKISDESYKIASKFYRGGFCEFNPNIQNQIVKAKNGIILDINSAHPNSMTKFLPYGEMINFKDEKPSGNYLEYWEIWVSNAHIKKEFENIPIMCDWHKVNDSKYKNNFRFVYNLAGFVCYYLKEEWDVIQKFYDIKSFKIVNKYWCRAGKYLETYINDLYELKVKHKKEGQEALANTYKILLNSSYGKHATRQQFSDYYVCRNKDEYDKLLKDELFVWKKKKYKVTTINDDMLLDNTYVVRLVPYEFDSEKYYNKLIAATITAYTRIKIFETIEYLGAKNFLYTDTDSIFLNDCDETKLKDLCDDYELGKWKLEKRFQYLKIDGAKVYIVWNNKEDYTKLNEKDIVKMSYSGINKRWLKDNIESSYFSYFDNENHNQILENANLKSKVCKSGVVIEPKNYEPKPRYH